MAFVALLWLGFRFGVDKDKSGLVRLLVWALYAGCVGLVAVVAPYDLLDAAGIHDLGVQRLFATSMAVIYAGACVVFVHRTMARRRATRRPP